MDPIERLSRLFERFPGIGPRQSQRFVQFLLRSPAARRELIDAARSLGGTVRQCAECMRFFGGDGGVCGICANPARDARLLAVVAADQDLLALERSGTFSGHYFVFGGTRMLGNDANDHLRTERLLASLAKRREEGLEEIVLAFPANPEGDATADALRSELLNSVNVKVTMLGRGLSTGSELEYADPETIKSALDARR